MPELPYRICLLWTAYGERAIARVQRAIEAQRAVPEVWSRTGKLLCIDRSDPAPDIKGVPVLRVDAKEGGTINLSRGLNRAFDVLDEHGWDFVQVLGADCYALTYPDPLPHSGFCAPRLYNGKEGETVPPHWEGDGWVKDSAAFLLHRDIYASCRFCEAMRGYGYEDLDYWYNVLWFAGHHTNESGVRLMHIWHGSEHEPRQDHPEWGRDDTTSDFRRNRRLWMERTARNALETGRADPGFPSHYHAEWGEVRTRVEAEFRKEREAQERDATFCHAEGDFDATRLPPNGFLVVRDGGLGDLLMLIPILRQLHRMGLYVCLACDPPYVNLMRQHPEIDRVMSLEQPWPDAPTSIDLRWKVDFLYGHPLRETHHRIDCWRHLFKTELDLDFTLDSYRPDLRIPEEWKDAVRPRLPDRPFALMQIFSSTGNRDYPRMVEVADGLLTAGVPVVACHSTPVHGLPEEVANLCGELSVEEAVAAASLASVVIAPDSGLMHAAGVTGVPFVALFGPLDPRLRLPIYDRYQVLRARPNCPPCHERYDCDTFPRPCLSEIPAEVVVEAALSFLTRP